ncbi:MAG: class I SAM-dependent methyltransferase [Nanoarchaeota archaeon]|nr:class I SAM-dependent methyltransferase [Nanoarchaeota archaeon]
MGNDWEEYWKSRTIISRIVDFMRTHYFADIPIYYLGDIKGKNILEAGCGTSESLVRIAKKAKKVTGLDLSNKSISLSKANFRMHNIPKEKYSLVLGDIHKMKLEDGRFDITFNAGVIEHFDDDRINNKPVKEMIRVTKKGGKIVILVPCVYSLFYVYYLVSRIPGLNKIYPGEESHRFYTFEMLKNQLDELNVKYKIRLCFRSLFVYLVAEITK